MLLDFREEREGALFTAVHRLRLTCMLSFQHGRCSYPVWFMLRGMMITAWTNEETQRYFKRAFPRYFSSFYDLEDNDATAPETLIRGLETFPSVVSRYWLHIYIIRTQNPGMLVSRTGWVLLAVYKGIFSSLLTDLLKGTHSQKVQWTREYTQLFQRLKACLCQEPVLYNVNFSKEFIF